MTAPVRRPAAHPLCFCFWAVGCLWWFSCLGCCLPARLPARQLCCRCPSPPASSSLLPPTPAPPAVRIFTFNGGHSRDVYHTKRMQRVFAVRFSGDGTYVFSGAGRRVWCGCWGGA